MAEEKKKKAKENGKEKAMHGLLRELVRAGAGDDEVFIRKVTRALKEGGNNLVQFEPNWSWYGGRRFWQAAA
ncbi:MAG: hypothetical protein AAF492_25535, partial [Verrucomicrobiota bacterium]